METTMKSEAAIGREAVKTNEAASMSSPAYQAYTLLLIGFYRRTDNRRPGQVLQRVDELDPISFADGN